MTDKTFKTFIAENAESLDDDKVRTRLISASGDIHTSNELMRWAKERFPDQFHPDPRKMLGLRPVLASLWAEYLEWKEEEA